MPANEVPMTTLAHPGTAEYRFLEAADNEGQPNRLITTAEIKSYATKHPEQADLIGSARIADWTERIANYTGDTVQPWVEARVKAAYASSGWKNGVQSAMLPLAMEADLNQADIRYVAKSAEPQISNSMWNERAMVHVALAQRGDLTQGTAQYIIDSVLRGASWRKTVRSVESAILRNVACRPFVKQLKFHELG